MTRIQSTTPITTLAQPQVQSEPEIVPEKKNLPSFKKDDLATSQSTSGSLPSNMFSQEEMKPWTDKSEPSALKGFAAGFITSGLLTGSLVGISMIHGVTTDVGHKGYGVAKASLKYGMKVTGTLALGGAIAGGVAGAFASQSRDGAAIGGVVGAVASGAMYVARSRTTAALGTAMFFGFLLGGAGGAAGVKVKNSSVLESAIGINPFKPSEPTVLPGGKR